MTHQAPRTLHVVGLGPGSLDRVSGRTLELLLDADCTVLLRTTEHPAAEELSAQREVRGFDEVYQQSETFDEVYEEIARQVVARASEASVVYAVPGSPLVGERTVPLIRALASKAGLTIEVHPAESFIDCSLAAVGLDPLFSGLQVLDGHDLPDPLELHLPTLIGHLTLPIIVADILDRLRGLLPDDQPVTVLTNVGGPGETVELTALTDLTPDLAGLRVSLFLDPGPNGLHGAITTMRRLRVECPWDAEQTHQSILPNLVEEAFELYDALEAVGEGVPGEGVEPAWGAYGEVEEELGDVLLQVLFHTTMGEEIGGVSLDGVTTTLREKLERRHPHVFGDVEAGTAGETLDRWERIKADEKRRQSALDGVPRSLPAIPRAMKLQQRAARVGFDWDSVPPVLAKVREEIGELEEAIGTDHAPHEVGDLIFAVVNLARHLGIDPELAARRAVDRFDSRFRSVEAMAEGPLDEMTLDQLDALWERAKEYEVRSTERQRTENGERSQRDDGWGTRGGSTEYGERGPEPGLRAPGP